MIVERLRLLEGSGHAPQQEASLQHVVEGRPRQEEVTKEFGNAEHTTGGQPLGTICFVGILYGFN